MTICDQKERHKRHGRWRHERPQKGDYAMTWVVCAVHEIEVPCCSCKVHGIRLNVGIIRPQRRNLCVSLIGVAPEVVATLCRLPEKCLFAPRDFASISHQLQQLFLLHILTPEWPSLRTIPTTTRSRRLTETVSSESRPTSTDREYYSERGCVEHIFCVFGGHYLSLPHFHGSY